VSLPEDVFVLAVPLQGLEKLESEGHTLFTEGHTLFTAKAAPLASSGVKALLSDVSKGKAGTVAWPLPLVAC
jgi:hypothetical protein